MACRTQKSYRTAPYPIPDNQPIDVGICNCVSDNSSPTVRKPFDNNDLETMRKMFGGNSYTELLMVQKELDVLEENIGLIEDEISTLETILSKNPNATEKEIVSNNPIATEKEIVSNNLIAPKEIVSPDDDVFSYEAWEPQFLLQLDHITHEMKLLDHDMEEFITAM